MRRFLSRADRADHARPGRLATLGALFGLQPATLPVAALSRWGETGLRPDGSWLRADPVHLRADQHRLLLFDARLLAMQMAEARQLAAELAPLFAEHGARLEVPHASRWYLCLPQEPGIVSTALDAAAGGDIDRLLPAGHAGAEWRRLLNEIQMLLHASSVNEAREAAGVPAVNSVWFWGEGALPGEIPHRWDRVLGSDPLVAGLALAARRTSYAPLPAPGDWLQAAGYEGEVLVVDDALQAPVSYGDPAAWNAALAVLEAQCMKPLLEAVRSGRVASCTLLPGDGTAWRLTRSGLRRFWRRTLTLASLVMR